MVSGSILAAVLLCQVAAAEAPADAGDTALATARKWVERSDRYLHHSKLRPDMEGHGLTVLSGTKIVRFSATIVSVLTKWGPHQDVILARLSGQGLEKTGLISGMSGSPVYVRDADGKDKLIGAVAFGWSAQKEPICGIQPITQMLTAVVAADQARKTDKDQGAKARAAGAAAVLPREVFAQAVLAPAKRRFGCFGWPARLLQPEPKAETVPALRPLLTPLMVRSAAPRTLREARRLLGPAGLMPVQAGGVAPGQVKGRLELQPGGAVSVPLATGDADYSAVGTVTDVVDGRVLAMGHAFFGEGPSSFPMGPGYVHMVVPSLMRSFKLTSALPATGTLDRDEMVGIAGRVGPKPKMIPMTISVQWKNDRRRQTYRYEICRHRRLTPLLAGFLAADAAWGWRELPPYHTVRYSLAVEFGKLGRYEAANVSSGDDVFWVLSDMERPIAALLNNPYGPPPEVTKVAAEITIDSGDLSAKLVDFRLDGARYRPGETLTGKVALERFRKPRITLPVKFDLPADLPEGTYQLQACNWSEALDRLETEMPHRFDPKTPAQLLQALGLVVEPKADALYLRLPVASGAGLALRQRELADLPDSRAKILTEADEPDTHRFSRAIVRKVATPYVLTGSAEAKFEVVKRPAETILHKKGS